jgi:hypothetical protein
MQKEIVRRFMKTQWVQERLKEDWVRETFEDWTIESLRLGLKPEGKPRYDDFIYSVQKGEQIALSDYGDMFLGFDFKSGIKGLENLILLKDKPILLVANHVNNGPMKGDWQHVVISYYVKETTGEEIRWLHGFDPTTAQDLFRERLHKSINSIPIRDNDPSRGGLLLRRAIGIDKASMGLYPEGDGSKNLRRGMPKAGRLIATWARNAIDIVSCSVRFQSDTFFLTFDTLDNETIKTIVQKGADRSSSWQDIADYAMRTIAQHLPENRRGYYEES